MIRPEWKEKIEKDERAHGSIPFWSWNDKLEESELRRQIRQMSEIGMRGFFMHARGGLETEYLSEEWFDAVRASVNEAKKNGMEAWAYDENGWPSGFGGEELLKKPENFACGLVFKRSPDFPAVTETTLAVYAVRGETFSRVDRAAEDAEEYLTVDRRYDHAYVDTMSPKIIPQFVASTHEKYLSALENFADKDAMPGFFTDEPQYYRWATPWSDTFLSAFEEKYGYSVFDALPSLASDGEWSEGYRYDYYRLCHESFYGNFMKPLYEWLDAHGLQLTGHGIEEWGMRGQMLCCGGIMPFYLYEHIPGIDYLSRPVKNVEGSRQLGSVCEQTGKKVRLSEMFAACGWDVSPRELKRIAESQFCGGVNLICEHLYPYSERGQRKRDYPHHYSEVSPWFSDTADFEKHFARLGSALSQGEETADTLVIHPVHTAWLSYRREKEVESVQKLEREFDRLCAKLTENFVCFHFGDETVMRELGAKTEGAKIRVGKCVYDKVILPYCRTLDSYTADLLREYLANGGKLWMREIGGKTVPPTLVDGHPGDLSFLRNTTDFSDIVRENPIKCSTVITNSPVRFMLRRTEHGKILFVANTSEESLPNFTLLLEDWRGVTEWVPLSGEEKGVTGRKNADGSLTVALDLGPAGSVLLFETDDLPLPYAYRMPVPTLPVPERATFAEKPENAFALDRAAYSVDGSAFTEERPIARVRDELLAHRTRGRVTLRYSFTARVLPEKLLLVTEPMRNETLSVNGVTLTPGGEYRIDPRFHGTDIASLAKVGENTVEQSFDYYQSENVYHVLYDGVTEALRNCLAFDTEIEDAYLFGDFSVVSETPFTPEPNRAERTEGPFFLDAGKETVDTSDLPADGYPFFCGTMTWKTSFAWQKGMPTAMRFTGRFSTLGVTVNGKRLPKLVLTDTVDLADVLREGENELILTPTFSARNLFGPHHTAEAEPLSVGRSLLTMEKVWENGEYAGYVPAYAFVRDGLR